MTQREVMFLFLNVSEEQADSGRTVMQQRQQLRNLQYILVLCPPALSFYLSYEHVKCPNSVSTLKAPHCGGLLSQQLLYLSASSQAAA